MSLVDQLEITLSESVVSAAASAGSAVSWHMIFPEGKYKHPRYGKLDFSEATLQQIKSNFDNRVRGIKIAVDMLHENKEAAGWIQSIDYRAGQGLFAEIEWTELGIEKIKKKLLRYFSPEFGTHTDELTEKQYPNTLIALTLTNFPFLKRLPEVDIRLDELTLFEEPVEEKEELAEKERCDEHDKPMPCPECKELEEQEKVDEQKQQKDRKSAVPSTGKPKLLKPRRGNQGATQPGMPSGAKPHINRGRHPDPTGEIGQMSDTNEENVENYVTLDEMRLATQKLEEALATERAERAKLEDKVRLAERESLERDVRDEVRTLSETRQIKADDGSTVAVKAGIPTVVTKMYEEISLSDGGFNRTNVYAMLQKIQEVGTVSLNELGVNHSGRDNDPDASKNSNGEVGTDLVVKASEVAKRDNLDLTKLSEREIAYQRAAKELS